MTMTASTKRHTRVALLLAFILVIGGAATWLSCSESAAVDNQDDSSPVALAPRSPESLGEIRDFTLTERSGRSVSRADLAGRVWVAGFVFTRCTGPCPKVTATMRTLQDGLLSTNAKLVSFSVDPEWDTPAVLTQYAQQVGADPERWWMLTGPQSVIDSVVPPLLPGNTRAEPGTAPIGESIGHNARLTVVDARGRVRGHYWGETTEHVARIVERVKFLESER